MSPDAARRAPEAPHTSTGDLRAVLAGSGFRRLLGVRLASQLSDGWFQAALAGSLLFNPDKQTSALAIATGFAILLLPYSLLGPYVGVFLDRWDRRGSLYLSNLIRVLFVLPVAVVIAAGDDGFLFAILALLVIATNRFFLAGLSAALPRVVADERLVTGNALASTLGTIAYSVGLFGAAVVVGTDLVGTDADGYASIAGTAAVGYLGSALLARWAFRRGDLGPDAHERPAGTIIGDLVQVSRGMVGGVRHLVRRRPAAYAMGVQSGHRFLYGVVTIAVLLLYSRYFGSDLADNTAQSLSGLGQVVIAGAAGAGLAAVITPPVTRLIGGHAWVTGLVAAVGVVVLACGLPFQAALLLVAAFLVNVASQSMKIVIDATLQHECDDEFRGRVFSINDTTFNLCFVLGLFVGAVTLPANGRSVTALLAVAFGYFLLASWYGLAARRWARPTEGPVPVT